MSRWFIPNQNAKAMFKRTVFLFLAALAALPQFAQAKAPRCDALYAGGVAPRVTAAAPARDPHILCYSAYSAMVSGETRTPLWSAEHLTAESVNAARELKRDSDFYEEMALPSNVRATLADFRGSGLDRGHLSPSGDFGDKNSQAESFSLGNVVPQNATSNRRMWSHLETSTRKLARQYGQEYVVTGPAFTTSTPRLMNGRVRIPDLMWKAIYIPGVGAAAYVAPNTAAPKYTVVSINEITKLTGVDPMPGIPSDMRGRAMDLPPPTPHPKEKAGRLTTLSDLLANPGAATESNVAETSYHPHHSASGAYAGTSALRWVMRHAFR